MGVYSKEHNPETNIKRNAFDLSFQNNITANIGGIYPVCLKEVLPGDTCDIGMTFGLRFMPTLFPIQNRMRVDIHAFYFRSRIGYNEFEQWYTHNQVSKPYPTLGSAMTARPDSFKSGELFDCFNIPTVLTYGANTPVLTKTFQRVPLSLNPNGYSNILVNGTPLSQYFSDVRPVKITDTITINSYLAYSLGTINSTGPLKANIYAARYNPSSIIPSFLYSNFTLPASTFFKSIGDSSNVVCFPCVLSSSPGPGMQVAYVGSGQVINNLSDKVVFDFPPSSVSNFNGNYLGVLVINNNEDTPVNYSSIVDDASFGSSFTSINSSYVNLRSISSSLDLNPYISSLPLNAMPFRAYEAIYNSFFRDERNNPYLINGVPTYSKYCPTTDGGVDNNVYKIRYRNWEQDQFTTALPTPQQGNAPLVGISASGIMTIEDSETGKVYRAQASFGDDNDTIVGASFIETNEDGSVPPVHVSRALVDYASSGISINDFRNVNALQRYLETNLRRGLKYRDMLSSRWGVNASYSLLDMPEFIGGLTEYVNPVQINQTSQDTHGNPLGSYAGQLYAQGTSKHRIRHYFDEPGYLIIVMSVVPAPIYMQNLPKLFTKSDPLDFFNPEFGHIGMQPVPMKEVAPLQQMMEDSEGLDSTFGYQRAWYDYLSSNDEVHGQFRETLRNFVMYRTFDGAPRLSEDFLVIQPDSVDNVFSVTHDSDGNPVDKIIGAVYFDFKMKRPIPRFGVPRLE